ncbi:MAG: hypothetical protein U0800_20190 [Isosphaeraceae bacterium]
MTAEEEAALGPYADAMVAAARNPLRYDPSLWAEYPGELIAWSLDGSRIVAHARDEETLRQLVEDAGEDAGVCHVQFVDNAIRV